MENLKEQILEYKESTSEYVNILKSCLPKRKNLNIRLADEIQLVRLEGELRAIDYILTLIDINEDNKEEE